MNTTPPSNELPEFNRENALEGDKTVNANESITVSASLAARVLRVALTLYLVVAVAVTLVQLTLEYNHEKKRLSAEVLHMLDTFEPILAQGFWNLDDEQMISTSYGILSNEFIFGVRVLEVDGAEMLAVGQIQRPGEPVISIDTAAAGSMKMPSVELVSDPDKSISPTLYSFERSVYFQRAIGGREQVGRIVVFSSTDIVIERAMYTFFITMVNAFVKTCFLWWISFAVLKRLVGKPLETITHAMQHLDLDERRSRKLTSELKEHGLVDRQDELGVLTRTFISMQEALSKKNAQLSSYHRELEGKVEERTKKLERALHAKSEFLANMSHEIRTPMNGVLGMTELLHDTTLTEEQRRYVKTILSSGQVLLSIINDVLDSSKIEAGMMEIESFCFDLDELIDDCVSMFAFKSVETGVELSANIESGSPLLVKGDLTRVRQILVNLLGNAYKFTETGRVQISIRQETDVPPDHCLMRFEVTDTGIGLDEEEQS
ncbi:MAG: HAMP domain-containing protein [Pseudomonadales bacterium]|nr:HAMP domain-containing protein [Pseudomonadales bacterium]